MGPNVEDRERYRRLEWSIFIPNYIINKAPGFLTGQVSTSNENGTICVLGIHETKFDKKGLIGCWHGDNKKSIETLGPILLNYDEFKTEIPDFALHLSSESRYTCLTLGSRVIRRQPVCIFYEPQEILSSYIFMGSKNSATQSTKTSIESSAFSKSSIIGENLGNVWKHFLSQNNSADERSCIEQQLTSKLKFVMSFFVTMFSLLHSFFYPSLPVLKNILSAPSFTEHLMRRCRRSHRVQNLDEKNSFHSWIKYNTYAQHWFESAVGVFVLYHALSNNLTDIISSSLLDWADDVANKSNDLIQWLMGAPAGMKLNSQLTNMLGHFFLYHIYLWTGYLSILRTGLPWLLVFAFSTGVLGISFQLCFIKDIISMLTLHIYCFYVYAARIFNLQTSVLASLWRLFRGKKWNVLRSRVDSAAYNTDQLFAGTLMFTVLLFLLPTTALYYAVFTGLRIITLVVQGALSWLIGLIDVSPIYSILLFVFRPKWIAGVVQFEVDESSGPSSGLLLNMKTCILPLCETIQLTAPYLKEADVCTHTWSELISCIATGKIMYPWVDVTDKDKNEEKDKRE